MKGARLLRADACAPPVQAAAGVPPRRRRVCRRSIRCPARGRAGPALRAAAWCSLGVAWAALRCAGAGRCSCRAGTPPGSRLRAVQRPDARRRPSMQRRLAAGALQHRDGGRRSVGRRGRHTAMGTLLTTLVGSMMTSWPRWQYAVVGMVPNTGIHAATPFVRRPPRRPWRAGDRRRGPVRQHSDPVPEPRCRATRAVRTLCRSSTRRSTTAAVPPAVRVDHRAAVRLPTASRTSCTTCSRSRQEQKTLHLVTRTLAIAGRARAGFPARGDRLAGHPAGGHARCGWPRTVAERLADRRPGRADAGARHRRPGRAGDRPSTRWRQPAEPDPASWRSSPGCSGGSSRTSRMSCAPR